jgi:hypothetical protein
MTRRRVPRRALVLSAPALLLLAGCAGAGKRGREPTPEADAAVLNGLLALEHEAAASYRLGRDRGGLREDRREQAMRFLEDHVRHAEAVSRIIVQLGGTPVAARLAAADFGLRADQLRSETDAIRLVAGIEKGLADAYLGAVPAVGDKLIAKAAANILGVETMHWTLWREALGEPPVPAPFVS